ncbi:MAG: hypothetical protein OXP12_07260 [Thaumarchaeota archaeon]|nr:hypothetical protein [Nitrososphaerota archaeon]MDE0526464.1 hypothetical protein [Nitrososphaerota archaeon]
MDSIPTVVNRKLDAQAQALAPKQESGEDQESAQVTDAKYQEVYYRRERIQDRISFDLHEYAPVDLQTALAETLGLSCADPTFRSNDYSSVIFYNQTNLNSVHILRTGEDLWNVDAPVFCDDPHARFKHITQLDTKRLTDMIKMFFEGDDWAGIVRFRFDSDTFKLETDGSI